MSEFLKWVIFSSGLLLSCFACLLNFVVAFGLWDMDNPLGIFRGHCKLITELLRVILSIGFILITSGVMPITLVIAGITEKLSSVAVIVYLCAIGINSVIYFVCAKLIRGPMPDKHEQYHYHP